MRPWFTGGNSALAGKRAVLGVAFAVAVVAIGSVVVAVGRPTRAVALGSLPKIGLDSSILAQTVTPTVTPTATPSLPLTGALQVSDTTPTRGQTITVAGAGYRANTDVRITIHSHISLLGNVRTGAGGGFSTNIVIPLDAHLGTHTLRATGDNPRGQTRVLSATIAIQDRTTAATNVLPKTGPAIAVALATIASALLILGYVLRGWSSQKRHPSNLPRL